MPPSRALCDRLQSAEAFLSDRSSAFKALRAATALGPEAVREALPENLKLVVLQHSDDGKRLLCSAISSARLAPTPPEPVEVEEGEEVVAAVTEDATFFCELDINTR